MSNTKTNLSAELVSMDDSKIERSEKDGLVVTINDETGVMTLDWDDETHPQWNFLRELGEEGVNELLLDYCNQVIAEHETKNLHDPGSSS